MHRVTATGLNLRSGPGIEYPSQRTLPRNTALIRLASSAAWDQVRTFDGGLGWVARAYVAPDPAPWLTVARGEDGTKEVVGAGHSARVLEYHGTTTLRATSDEVPWCSAFANWCVLQVGMQGTRLANARSWLQWGFPLEKPREGCIVVLYRGLNPHSGHVAFYEGRVGDQIRLYGGNQNNRVCSGVFPSSRVLGYRWPIAT